MPSRFDIKPLKTMTKLTLDVERATIDKVHESNRAAKVLKRLRETKILTNESSDSATQSRFVLQPKAMNRFREAPNAVVEALGYLYMGAESPELPDLAMSDKPVSTDGRYGMILELKWPEADAACAADFATLHMRRFARSLNDYGSDMPRQVLEELVYAQADRGTGVVFQTNPLGSCSLESDHMGYYDEPTVSLVQHNLYNSEQQLICLVGAVAFANADRYI